MAAVANVVIVDNPHAKFALEQMRNRKLGTIEFRRHSDEVARCLADKVAYDYRGQHEGPVVIAPILRAGLALEREFCKVFAGAAVHHIGVRRNEKTFVPEPYYPPDGHRLVPPGALVITIDPMNATGGSGGYAIRELKSKGASKVIFVNVVSAREGVERVQGEFSDVDIYTVAVDPDLDSNKYIVPGLGDYGDRYYGTV